MRPINPQRLIVILWCCIPCVIIVAVSVGAVHFSLTDLYTAVATLFSPQDFTQIQTILIDIRLPRALLAVSIGAILGICGAITQGLFRNPLADPSLIGVTAGASLGASISIVVFSGAIGGLSMSHWAGLPLVSLGAFLGGALAVLFVYRLSKTREGTSVATMLLAGIGMTAFAGSMTSFLEFYADNQLLRRMSLWKMGGLEGADQGRLFLAIATAASLCFIFPRFSQAYNAFLLGESEARHLGISVEKIKTLSILLVAAGVGISVALAGTIAFVGLVVPHMMRLLIGPDHRYLLIASALGGALLLSLADIVARVLLAPVELPVGLVTALIGVPFFISLLKRRRLYEAL